MVDESAVSGPSIPWSTIIQQIDDGIIILDDRERVVSINPAAATLLQIKPESALGGMSETVFAAFPRAGRLYKDLRALTDDVRRDDTALGSSDDPETEHFIEMRLNTLEYADGGRAGFVVIIRDITEHKRAQLVAARRMAELAALRNVDWRISSTLEIDDVLEIALNAATHLSGADAGFISLAEHGVQRVLKVSGAYAQELVGAEFPFDLGITGRVVRTQTAELVQDVSQDPDYLDKAPNMRAQMSFPLVVQDRMVGVMTLEARKPDNFKPEVFEFVRLLAGRIAIALDNAHLYTILQTQLDELQSAYNQISRLEQVKTEMIRITSHDLLSPLSIVMGYLSLLDSDRSQLSTEHSGFVDEMIQHAQRMENLIRDILSLEQINQDAEAFEAFVLGNVVGEVLSEQRRSAANKDLNLTFTPPGEPLHVAGRRAQIHEAVVNLINNAIKYTPEGGEVRIVLERSGGQAIFRVIDNGYGIREDLQDKLFQPFYRAVSGDAAAIMGTGLGLHLVKNIIERHHGQIIFESIYGEGSTFGFNLPLHLETTGAEE